jgi:hypothetical protein
MIYTKNPTLATVKAFMKKNADRLFVQNQGDYNKQTKSFEYYSEPRPWRSVAGLYNPNSPNDFGIGVWFARGEDNSVRPYSDADVFEGFAVTNCYSAFVVAVKN